MIPCQIEIVIAINDAKKKAKWNEGQQYELHGTIGKYNIQIAGYYKTRNGKKIVYYVRTFLDLTILLKSNLTWSN